MQNLFVFLLCVVSVLAAPPVGYDACNESNCKLPDCKCSTYSQGNNGEDPQFVVLSFDDSASALVFDSFVKPEFLGRKNPDGCPISGTFFIPHEYTDYSVVNKLYSEGFEIASHSITKNFLQDYWKFANEKTLIDEMGGQRTILKQFANIPEQAIIGARIPQLQLNNVSFEALDKAGFVYDSSWPTMQIRPMGPYTLDYDSIQQCHVAACQTRAVPGFWEMPIVDWINADGDNCNSIDACSVLGSEEKIFEWMKKNYNAINKTGAPISFRVNLSWYNKLPENQGALKKFLDFLGTEKNTYIVSYKQVLEWTQNPEGNFTSCQNVEPTPCIAVNCRLEINGAERYMTVCNTCPKNYPWIGNPTGA